MRPLMKLEPLTRDELGEYADKVQSQKVYGLLRRADLAPGVLETMRRRRAGISPEEIAYLRVRKSRRWQLPLDFPQLGWEWLAAFDFGPYKSTYNGKRDLDGGRLCDLCHTWIRYGHLLQHSDWKHGTIIVGRRCSILLSDIDPNWAEKKLAHEFGVRLNKERERRRLEAEREQALRDQAERQMQEAADIAVAMLRDYTLREQGVPCRIVPLTPGRDILATAGDAVFRRACEERQQLIAANVPRLIDDSIYRTTSGNYHFEAEVTGIPFSGTIFRRDSMWRFVINRPGVKAAEFSDSYIAFCDCERAMVDWVVRALCEYVTTPHARQKYPWETRHERVCNQ